MNDGLPRRAAAPGDLDALWRRTLIVMPDGRHDTTGTVLWLQRGSSFSDLRQPSGRPPMEDARSLDGLSDPQMRWLATQNGFAGTLAFDGRFFEWQREIAWQPAGPLPDSAELFFDGKTLVELGQHEPYREDWVAVPAGSDRGGALRLRDPANGRRALLVRHGSHFMFARDRSLPLTPGGTLLERLAGAGTERARRELIDCEISFGGISTAGEWRIERSTLPYREGGKLLPHWAGSDGWEHSDLRRDGTPFRQQWQVSTIEGNADDLALPV